MSHLGEKNYSFRFPLITSFIMYALSELIGNFILNRPNDMGPAVVMLTFFLILYFSFRCAIKGGVIVIIVSTVYFTYFIASRNVSFSIKEAAVLNVVVLTVIYIPIALIVGFLRKTIDDLFAKEQQARINAEKTKGEAEHEKKRLQTLLAQLPVGVIIATSPTGKIISRNERAMELLGSVKTQTKSIRDYQNFNAYINERKIKSNEWPLARAVTNGETVTAEELVVISNKNKKKTLLFNAAPIRDKKGKVIAAVTTFNDITKQKELERQKDDFIALASHELKTPLTSARIYAQALLKDASGSPKSRHFSQKINEQLERLSILITTMLDTTRMEQGRLILKEEPFILRELALKTLADLEVIINRELTIDWPTTAYVYGNKERIAQVFTNLITNAVKFSSDDSDIIVKSQKKDSHIVVSVQDFGIGLAVEDQKHVFEKFYHADAHRTYPGLGLGLYISSEIVKQYGGNMWVESVKGKGSTFFISFPIYKRNI